MFFVCMKRDEIFPIGIGGWGIGGFAERDVSNDDKRDIEALTYSLKKGMNFVEVNYWYSEGRFVELLGEAIKKSEVSRRDLFLNQAIYHFRNKSLNDVNSEIDKVMKILDTDYLDSVEFLLSSVLEFGFGEVVDFLKGLLDSGKIRFVSVTNFDLENLKKFKEIFGDKLFCHELHFNFEIRENEDLGITKFGDDTNILNVICQPIRRNRTASRNWSLLIELAEKYRKTQNQIIINWLAGRGFLPLIKSSNIKHIDENIGALGFEMKGEDIEKLNDFRTGWKCPKIVFDRREVEDGEALVDQLSNVFDDIYDEGVK